MDINTNLNTTPRCPLKINYIFLIGIVGGGIQLGPSALRPPVGLLCRPRVIMMMEKLVE
jgi:hypothetical protein